MVTFLLPSTSGILFWTQYFKRELGRLELIPEEDEQLVSQLGILFDEDFLFFLLGLSCGTQDLQLWSTGAW